MRKNKSSNILFLLLNKLSYSTLENTAVPRIHPILLVDILYFSIKSYNYTFDINLMLFSYSPY